MLHSGCAGLATQGYLKVGTYRFCLILLLLFGAAMPIFAETTVTKPLLRVGLLIDLQCTDAKSREAAWALLSADSGLRADRISTEVLLTSRLHEYDVIVFPGGSGSAQASLLGTSGGDSITQFVKRGKGVVAICAGGYLVVEGWGPATRAIELVNARLWDSNNGRWARGEQFVTVQLLRPDTPPATSGSRVLASQTDSTSQTMWYENGPLFVAADMGEVPAYTPLVRYVTDLHKAGEPAGLMQGSDAVIAGELGNGRVVVFGPHPELSPGLHHWLRNAIRWAAGRVENSQPTVASVLEGQ